MEKFTFTSLNEAYNIHHVNGNSYTQPIQYSSQCIYCSTVVSKAIENYANATTQLKGTN
jgi:hypothetical protein